MTTIDLENLAGFNTIAKFNLLTEERCLNINTEVDV